MHDRPRRRLRGIPESATANAPGKARRPWGLALEGPVVAADEGTLPSSGRRPGSRGRDRLERVRLMLSGRYGFSQSTTTRASTRCVSRWSGGVSGCYAWSSGRFEVGPCAAATLENVAAQGIGPQVSGGPGRESWLALGLSVRAAWAPAGWASVFLRPSLTFNTARPTSSSKASRRSIRCLSPPWAWISGCEWIL